jgi:hypothetical protein
MTASLLYIDGKNTNQYTSDKVISASNNGWMPTLHTEKYEELIKQHKTKSRDLTGIKHRC